MVYDSITFSYDCMVCINPEFFYSWKLGHFINTNTDMLISVFSCTESAVFYP